MIFHISGLLTTEEKAYLAEGRSAAYPVTPSETGASNIHGFPMELIEQENLNSSVIIFLKAI